MDRYLAICRPFLARKYDLCSLRRAKVVSVSLMTGNVLYNLPRFWEYEYVTLETQFDGLVAYVPVPTSLRTNFYYDTCYVHLSYIVGLFLVPVIYLAVFNIKIFLTVSCQTCIDIKSKIKSINKFCSHICILFHARFANPTSSGKE